MVNEDTKDPASPFYKDPHAFRFGKHNERIPVSQGGNSLFAKVKRRVHESREQHKLEKAERKSIEKEAKEEARKEYLMMLRTKRIENLKAQARARARREAVGGSGLRSGLGGVGKGIASAGKRAAPVAKSGWNMLAKAGKNTLDTQFDFSKGVPDFGFGGGFQPAKKTSGKGKKKKAYDPLKDLF